MARCNRSRGSQQRALRYRAAGRLGGQSPDLLTALEALQHCQDVRGHLADLLTGIRTTPKLAWRLAAADGVLRIAAVAAKDPGDFPIQLYALHVLAALIRQHHVCDGSSVTFAGHLSPDATAAVAAVANEAATRFPEAEIQQQVCKVFASLAACGELAATMAQAGAAEATNTAFALDQCGAAGKHLVISALQASHALGEAGIHSAEVEDLLAVLRRNLHTPDVQAMALKAVHGHLLQKGDRISQGARTRVLTAVLAGVEEHSAHLELQLAASKLLADFLPSAFPGGARDPLAAKAAAAVLRACIRFDQRNAASENLQEAFVRISESLPVEAFADVLDSQNADSEPVHWVKAANISRRSPSLQKSLFQHANRLVCRGFGQALANHGAAQLVVEAMRLSPLDAGLQRVSCEVLAALARCDLDGIIRAGGLDATVHALRRHQPYAWVCTAALQTLLVLCVQKKQEISNLTDLWNLTMGTLRQHPKSQNIVKMANEMLMFLSKYEAKQVAREDCGHHVTRSPCGMRSLAENTPPSCLGLCLPEPDDGYRHAVNSPLSDKKMQSKVFSSQHPQYASERCIHCSGPRST
ncbi:unnamed protein product [Symbiodinium microadriaticum]|nr:unnamed protein product [Symbiodinium sp. KB8]CAE7688870.1 unnamed protein product [Symbiodinium microadriaticum]